eukprot:7018938-Pyramimonas_sp.AAC.1
MPKTSTLVPIASTPLAGWQSPRCPRPERAEWSPSPRCPRPAERFSRGGLAGDERRERDAGAALPPAGVCAHRLRLRAPRGAAGGQALAVRAGAQVGKRTPGGGVGGIGQEG